MVETKIPGINRRDFVRSSAAAAGALAVGFPLPALAQNTRTEITFASAPFFSRAAIDGLLEEFNTSQNAISASYMELPSAADADGLHAELVTRLQDDENAPDIFSLDIVRIAEFAAAGLSLPLSEHFKTFEREEFFPGVMNGCTVNGELMAMPWFIDCGMLFYRKDILERIGADVPSTWDDLVATSLSGMDAQTPYGYLWQGKTSEALITNIVSIIGSNGSAILSPGGAEIAIGSREAIEAVQFLHDAINTYGISPSDVLKWDEEPARKPFNAGQSVFLRNWSYTWGLAHQGDSAIAGKIGVAPLPHFAGKSSAACLGGFQFGVNAQTKNREAAIEVLRWLTRPDIQLKFAMQSGLAPTRSAVFDNPALAVAQPFLAQLKGVFAGALARPVTPIYPQVTEILQQDVAWALESGKVEAALGSAQKRLEALLLA